MEFTPDEERSFVSLLDKLEWGRIPPKIFSALVRNIRTVPIELGIFRDGLDGLEVLLLQRPMNDPDFLPGGWHMPGTPVFPDQTVAETIARLLKSEVYSTVNKPTSLGWYEIGRDLVPARPAISLLHACRLTGQYTGEGSFWPVQQLPDTTLEHHMVLVKAIVDRLPVDF